MDTKKIKSSNWKNSWDKIKRLRAEIEEMKSKIDKKQREIDAINKTSGNTSLSGAEDLLDELKTYRGVKVILNEEGSEFSTSPNVNSGETQTFQFINPNGVKIGVEFEETYITSDVWTYVIGTRGKILTIESGSKIRHGVKDFASKLIEITPEWVNTNKA